MAKEVLKKKYAKLVKVLPMDDANFRAELVSHDLLTHNHKAKVHSLLTQAEKAEYFIDNVITPEVDADISTEKLEKLLSVMSICGQENLADEIKGELQSVSSTVDFEPSPKRRIVEKAGGKVSIEPSEVSRSALEKLAPHLYAMYSRTRYASKHDMWPPSNPKLFKNLTFLHQDSRSRQERLSQIAARYKHTKRLRFAKDVKSDVSKNFPMFKALEEAHLSFCKSGAIKNMADLFIDIKILQPNSILVEGAPGIGKTEMIKEIACLWAKSEILLDIKLTFVLYLRDPSIQRLKSLEMFIHQHINNNKRYLNDQQAKKAVQELRDSQGSNIAFLMDGFDEFPSDIYGNSFVADLINGEVLPNALLFITSRPSVSLVLHNRVGKIFDIVGFDKHEREQYILDSLKDQPKLQKELQQYLKEYPIINSYCYIPLYLAIVIFLLKHGNFPRTLTRMNELFIVHTINRSLQQYCNSKQYKKLRIAKLKHLSQPLSQVVHQLSKLAYDGVQNSKLVFSLKEIKELCPEIDSITGAMNGCGLLQAVEHYDQTSSLEMTTSFNFLHYSMQEYLAAFYIQTLSNKEQYSIMASIKTMNYALSPAHGQCSDVSSFWHSHFVFMWQMYVGITGMSWALTLFLSQLGFFVEERARNIPRNTLHVVHILHLFQCFVEASNDQICNLLLNQVLFRDGRISIKGTGFTCLPFFSHHMLSLVFFLTKSSKQYTSLEFANCFIFDDAMNILNEYLLSYPEKGCSIKHARFENVRFVSCNEMFRTITNMVSELIIINIDGYNIKNLMESLGYNHSLSTLEIRQMKMVDDSIELLLQQLSKNTTLKSLNITDSFCTQRGAKAIAGYIRNNSTLQKLNVSVNMIGLSERLVKDFTAGVTPFGDYRDKSGVAAITCALKKNSSLLSLNLSNNSIAFLYDLALALDNTVLRSVDLSGNLLNCDDVSAFCVLGSKLRFNQTLKSLNISKNNIGDTRALCVIEALYYNKTLQSLDISNNNLSFWLCKDLAHALQYNNSLSLLALGSNDLGDVGTQYLATALELNTTITSLYLRDNMIMNVGAKALAAALKRNMVLQKLDLSFNDISDEGAFLLFDAFYVNSALKVLYIPFNRLTKVKQLDEMFTKLLSENTSCCRQFHIPVTKLVPFRSTLEVTTTKSDKSGMHQNLQSSKTLENVGSAIGKANSPIHYVVTSNKRSIIFTYGNACFESWDICLKIMYSHALYQNNALEEECLECYTQTIFKQLFKQL